MAKRKNTRRIDPRYFMDEKTEVIKEQGSFSTNMPDDIPSTADVMQKMRDDGTAPEEEHGNAGDIHSEQSPVPGKSAPQFGPVMLDWESDVDMGLYIVYTKMKKSKSEPELLRWLSSLGYTQDEMTQQGEMIKKVIRGMMESHPEWQGYQNQNAMRAKKVTLRVPATAQAPAGSAGGGGGTLDDDPFSDMPGFGRMSESKRVFGAFRKFLNENTDTLLEYKIPRGFMRIKDIPIPGRDKELEAVLKGNPTPMTWSQNNGVMIVIPENPQDAAVWIPEEKGGAPDATRQVPYRDAKAVVKEFTGRDADYMSIYVPFSN